MKWIDYMKIVNLYEITSSDGYTDRGEGRYFLSESEAKTAGEIHNKGWSSTPKKHNAIENEEGGFFILQKSSPVYLEGSPAMEEYKKKKAFEKLTSEDRKLLGLD
jgi:hypothetical protein